MKKQSRKKRKRRHSLLYKFIFLIEIIIILAFIIFGILLKSISSVNTTPLEKEKLVTVHEDTNMDDYTNIALFGVDTRSEDLSSEKSRSDAIIVASINNQSKEVKLISLYRDTYCSVNGTYTKLTHAYAYGGPELAISTINRNLDLNIEQYATVNFKIMVDIVNAIGGVELEVESDFIDDLNTYIREMNRQNGGNSPEFTSAGPYTFDGNQAVAYARIRHNQNGDFSRASRQRILLQAIAKQAQHHPLSFLKAVNKVLPQVQTNMTTSDITKMLLSASSYNIVENDGFPYDHTEARLSDGLYYDIPRTLKTNVIKLHENLFGTENYQVSNELNKINDKICLQTGFY